MTTSDWINLIAAILVGGGTLFLGIMAWRTICQTRSIQKAEKRERLLNEIIEWASGCMSCAFEIDRPHLREANSAEQFMHIMKTDLTDRLKSFKTKERYIKGIATPSLFGKSLSDAIKISIDCLDLTIKYIEKDTPSTDEEERKQVKAHLNEFMNREGGGLYKCMNKVLEEAAKIKTRDMGNKEENMSKEGEPARSNEIILKDIEKHLTRIEGYVIQIRKNMKAQGVGGFGFTGMAAGMALVATGVQTTGGLVIFGVGLIGTLYSFYFM